MTCPYRNRRVYTRTANSKRGKRGGLQMMGKALEAAYGKGVARLAVDLIREIEGGVPLPPEKRRKALADAAAAIHAGMVTLPKEWVARERRQFDESAGKALAS